MDLNTKPASDYPMPALVEILNRGFEDYIVPIQLNLTAFFNMVRKDSIDLPSSRVLIVQDQPVGLAMIARRGWTSRLASMAITKEMRGLGAGSWFMEALIQDALRRGEHEMLLEVIEKNEPAAHLYGKCGFQIVRRLIGFIRQDATEDKTLELHEIDLRQAGNLISQYGLPDLPWQLSGETIAQMNPPARAYGNGQVYAVISNPDVKDIAILSLLVKPDARGNGLGVEMLKSLIADHAGKTWHVPAILPEELGRVYERAGFVKEELSQRQMKLIL